MSRPKASTRKMANGNNDNMELNELSSGVNSFELNSPKRRRRTLTETERIISSPSRLPNGTLTPLVSSIRKERINFLKRARLNNKITSQAGLLTDEKAAFINNNCAFTPVSNNEKEYVYNCSKTAIDKQYASESVCIVCDSLNEISELKIIKKMNCLFNWRKPCAKG